jgi:hypothetical protein
MLWSKITLGMMCPVNGHQPGVPELELYQIAAYRKLELCELRLLRHDHSVDLPIIM